MSEDTFTTTRRARNKIRPSTSITGILFMLISEEIQNIGHED